MMRIGAAIALAGLALAGIAGCFDDDARAGASGADAGPGDGAPGSASDLLDGGPHDGGEGEDDEVFPPCDPAADGGASACPWRWQTPMPTGESFSGIVAFADDDQLALAGKRLFHRNGRRWSYLAGVAVPGGTDLAGAIGGHLYTLDGLASRVWHSSDRGATWNEEALPAIAAPVSRYLAHAVERDTQWAVAGGVERTLAVRDPATGQWTSLRVDGGAGSFGGIDLGPRWLAVGAAAVDTGLLAVAARLAPTIWSPATLPPGTPPLEGACSGSSGATTRSWAVGAGGAIISSTDGTTWTRQPAPATATLFGCAALDAASAYAYGAGGTLLRTTDGGVSWTQVAHTSWAFDLRSSSISPTSRDVTIVGDSGTIVRMERGTTLRYDTTGPNDRWQTMFAASRDVLFAAGAGGAIAKTTDGRRWTKLGTGFSDATLGSIWAASATDIYAVGNGPGGGSYVLHSTDGVTFQRSTPSASGGIPSSTWIVGVAGMNGNRVFVATGAGVFRSVDQGASWQLVDLPDLTAAAVALHAHPSGVWLATERGKVLHSTDGIRFRTIQFPPPYDVAYVRALTGDVAGNVWAVSSSGVMTKISPGGVLGPFRPVPMEFETIAVSPSGTAFYGVVNYSIGRLPAGIWVTRNDGASWSTPFRDLDTKVRAVTPVTDDSLFVVTSTNQAGGIAHWGN